MFFQLHNLSQPICHGHLTSHNLFIEHDDFHGYKIWIGDLELQPFIKIGALFNNYSVNSVWSSPEVLFQQKIQDFNKAMDVYSFSILFWEILHEQIPFDNDLNLAKSFVCDEHSRP
jgi:serine/threonine protein kinase